MTEEYTVRPIAWLVSPSANTRIFGERSYKVEIDDEGGGEYVTITSHGDANQMNAISVDSEGWKELSSAMTTVMAEIQRHEGNGD